MIKHSPYYFDDNIKGANINFQMFTIINLNCASIKATIDQIKIKLQQLENNGTHVIAVCIQVTWLSDESDTSVLQIDDYYLISQGKMCNAHGGLSIYLKKHLSYKLLTFHEESTIWEGQFTEITIKSNTKEIILGNLYWPPMDINDNGTCSVSLKSM